MFGRNTIHRGVLKMYNTNGLLQLTTFQVAVLFGAIVTCAMGVLIYHWKTQGDDLLNSYEGGSKDIAQKCKTVIDKDYYNS